jgi:hypothetical protein
MPISVNAGFIHRVQVAPGVARLLDPTRSPDDSQGNIRNQVEKDDAHLAVVKLPNFDRALL